LLEIDGGLNDLNDTACLELNAMNQMQCNGIYLGNTTGPVISFDESVRHAGTGSTTILISNTKIHAHDNGFNGIYGEIYINNMNQMEINGSEITEWLGYGIQYSTVTYMKIHGNQIRPLPSSGINSIFVVTGDSNTNEFFFNTYEKTIGGSSILIEGNRNRLGSGIVRGTFVTNVSIPTNSIGTVTVSVSTGHTITNAIATPKGAESPSGWYITNFSGTGFDFVFPSATPAGLSFDILAFNNSSMFRL